MAIFRKESGSLVRKAGKAIIDLALNRTSNHAIANSAVTAKFDEIESYLSNIPNISTLSNTYTFTGGSCTVNNSVFKSTSKVIVFQNANSSDFHSIVLSAVSSTGSVQLVAYSVTGAAYSGTAKLLIVIMN